MKIVKITLSAVLISSILLLNGCQEKSLSSSVKEENEFIKKRPTINIKKGEKISSPLKLKINSQGVWYASEGELGTVEIVDEKNRVLNQKGDWVILFSSDGNWMHSNPAYFETTVKFDPKGAKKGKIIIYNNPGEADGEEAGTLYHFEILIKF